MNKLVLLFGAGGQLGELIKSSAPTGLTLLTFSSKELDITDELSVAKLIKETGPSVVINAAAYTQVDKAESEVNAAYAVNASGPANIARAADKETRIVHISTDFVFSGNKASAYSPLDLTEPLSVYGKSKLEGENSLLALKPDNVIIIRTAWLYSARGKNFVNTMLHLMRERDELSVVADQKGTPTSAQALAETVWKFVRNKNASGIYHWTDEGETTWYDFACTIQAIALDIGLLEREITLKAITTNEYPTPAKRPMYSVLDKTSSYKALGLEGSPWQTELEKILLQIKNLA